MYNDLYKGTIYGVDNIMVESTNTLATDYVVEHYNELVRCAAKMGVAPSKVHDIVHDVYTSLVKSESNNEGYDPSMSSKRDYITVEEFVYGRLKGYSKNKAYYTDSYSPDEVCASATTDVLDDMSPAQKAYESAATFDEIESLNDELSIAEETRYILSFENETKLNIRFILKNIQNMATMDFDVSIMAELKEMFKNVEFAEAFRSIVTFAGRFPAKYEMVAASL